MGLPSTEICVIYNPAAGRGRGARRVDYLRRTLPGRADFRASTAPGQGEELARAAARQGFEIVAAAGGDGTVHEVANGLLQAERPETALAVFPLGSANDYAYSLGLDADWWRDANADVDVYAVDVGEARVGERRRYFVNGLGLGFNGAVTQESRRIKRLRGVALYGLAFLRALRSHFQQPPMNVGLDDVHRVEPTLALTLALGQREGNFRIAPEARLEDGLLDYVWAGPLTRWRLLTFLPGMITGHLPTNHPGVRWGRCRRARVQAEAALLIHLDGELFCLPEDNCHDLDVMLHPGRLRVLGKRPQPASGGT